MDCTHCNAALPALAAFCPQCGKHVLASLDEPAGPEQVYGQHERAQPGQRAASQRAAYGAAGAEPPPPPAALAPGTSFGSARTESRPSGTPDIGQHAATFGTMRGTQPAMYGEALRRAAASTQAAPARRYAGLWSRGVAQFIDIIVATVVACAAAFGVGIIFAIAVLIAHSGDAGTPTGDRAIDADQDFWIGVGLVVGFVVGWFGYFLATSVVGDSPGRRVFRMKVVREARGGRPGWRRGFVRMLVQQALLAGGITWLLDSVAAAVDDRRRTWHDRAAGTVVIRT